MSCQIKDYHGAPLTLTAALFHFMPLHQLFTKPAKEMERVPGECWRGKGQNRGAAKSEGRDKVLTKWEPDNYRDAVRGKRADIQRLEGRMRRRMADNQDVITPDLWSCVGYSTAWIPNTLASSISWSGRRAGGWQLNTAPYRMKLEVQLQGEKKRGGM